jgi:hypothetical protein
MEFKREYPRGGLVGTGVITVLDGRQDQRDLAFDVVNISASGILVQTRASLEKNDRVQVQLEISGRFDRNIRLEGLVLSKSEQGDHWEHAIKIKKIDPQNQIELDEMVAASTTFDLRFSEGLVYDEDEDSDLATNWPEDAPTSPGGAHDP